jgi:hypothetical protein
MGRSPYGRRSRRGDDTFFRESREELMSNPNIFLIKNYLKLLLKSLQEKEAEKQAKAQRAAKKGKGS